MDSLTAITGLGIIVFTFIYTSFSLMKEKHQILKIMLLVFGFAFLLFVPSIIQEDTNRDCGILNNGTYICFYGNGTQISDIEEPITGGDLFSILVIIIWVFVAYWFIIFLIYVFNNFAGLSKLKGMRFRGKT